MNYSTHYNLNLAEGTDLVNPLTVDVPNYTAIDTQMYANEQAGVGTATELKSGTIHAITRANTNRNVFRFKSTSVFLTGDTFTVDGGSVTALYPDGSSLKDRCFIIGSEVLCILDGAQLTVLASYYPSAQEVPFDDTNVSFTASNVQTAIEKVETEIVTTSEDLVAFTNSKCDLVYEITCRRNGNVVNIATLIHNENDIINAGETLTTQIPAKYRPTHSFAYFVSTNDIIIQANSDGTLVVSNISANIPANRYYPINLVYIV